MRRSRIPGSGAFQHQTHRQSYSSMTTTICWSSAVMALEKADDFTFCRTEGPKPNLPRPGSYRRRDFKLHTDYRAAVTLGPELTKRRVVQVWPKPVSSGFIANSLSLTVWTELHIKGRNGGRQKNHEPFHTTILF